MKRRHEVLFAQLETYRGELLDLLDGVTEEDGEISLLKLKANMEKD